MKYRKIAEGMIEATYDMYKDWRKDSDQRLSEELNKYNEACPVWRDMDDNTKCAAIEYVYNKREEIELHSDCVESWVQATAYFMLYEFAQWTNYEGETDLEIFFDDLDFTMDSDILNNETVQEQMGICANFTEGF